MTGEHLVIIIAGSLILGWALITFMVKANRRERSIIERRRAEWIASGADPANEPNFYSGRAGDTGS